MADKQAPKKNPLEIGIIWRKKTEENIRKPNWSGRIQGKDVVGFTFVTEKGWEGMSIQLSRSQRPNAEIS